MKLEKVKYNDTEIIIPTDIEDEEIEQYDIISSNEDTEKIDVLEIQKELYE